MELQLQSDLIYTNKLNTDNFARMLKDPSQCYKFYWLEAILTLMETTDGDLSLIPSLMRCVPYRLLSSFLNEVPGTSRLWYQRRQMIQYLLQVNGKNDSPLPYIIMMARGWRRRFASILTGGS